MTDTPPPPRRQLAGHKNDNNGDDGDGDGDGFLGTSARSRRRTPPVLRSYQSFPHLLPSQTPQAHTDMLESLRNVVGGGGGDEGGMDSDNYGLATPTPAPRKLTTSSGRRARSLADSPPPSSFKGGRRMAASPPFKSARGVTASPPLRGGGRRAADSPSLKSGRRVADSPPFRGSGRRVADSPPFKGGRRRVADSPSPFDGSPFDGSPFDGSPFDASPFDASPSRFAIAQPRRLTFSTDAAMLSPASAPASAAAAATMFTPAAATKLVRPDPAAFMSTGLQSRKQHVRTRSGGAQVAPETPCKRALALESLGSTPWAHQSAPKAAIDGDPFRLGKHRAASPGSLRRTRKRPHVALVRGGLGGLGGGCDDLRALLDTPSRARTGTLVDDDAALRPPGFRIPASHSASYSASYSAAPSAELLAADADACSDSTAASDSLRSSEAMMMDSFRPTEATMTDSFRPTEATMMDSFRPTEATMMDSFRPTEEMDCDQRAVFFSPASFSGNDEIARGSVDAVRGDVDGANTDVFTARFDVLRRIGEGEFASVYSVRSVADGRAYAVKRARRAFAGRLERARRLREAELLWAVAPHAAVVRLHAAWEQRGVLHLQLELCAHGSLAAWLDARAAAGDERPCERVAWAVLAHAAEGLAAVHARGVAHFDVKPANFLLTAHFGDIKNNASAWLKLADFGHAVRLPPPRDAWVDEGDREYLAPEMLGGVYSAAADVFSLGMMMLEIVADVVLPANGPDWHSLRAGCFDDPAFARLPYSPLLVDTIKRMLRADPARRPPLASVIATARAQIAEDDDIDDEDDFTAAPAPTARRLAPPSQLLLARANTSFHSATSDHLAAAPLRPASAGPGLARRTASAPGAAAAFPASSAASASASSSSSSTFSRISR